jgi:hypothetical protein
MHAILINYDFFGGLDKLGICYDGYRLALYYLRSNK